MCHARSQTGFACVVSIGACIRDLELIATVGTPEDLESVVQFLPL